MVRHADGHEYTASPVAQPKLVKLSDSGFRLGDRASDVRGLGVFGRNGERMGNVKDLYVDTLEREVRFLDVGAGGFLGLREKRFLIPVEAIAEFREGGVTRLAHRAGQAVEGCRHNRRGSSPQTRATGGRDSRVRLTSSTESSTATNRFFGTSLGRVVSRG